MVDDVLQYDPTAELFHARCIAARAFSDPPMNLFASAAPEQKWRATGSGGPALNVALPWRSAPGDADGGCAWQCAGVDAARGTRRWQGGSSWRNFRF
jgi:hypothetical protein